MRFKWTSAVFLVGAAGAVLFGMLRRESARKCRTDWPVNFAHRGDSAHAPENTLESFRRAIEAGAGGLELDVHMTRNGEIVVFHDDTLQSTTDGTGLVQHKKLAELKQLDAGYRYTEGDAHPYRGRGIRVPALEEVYEEFPGIAVNIEIKKNSGGTEEAVLSVIRKAGAEERTLAAAGRHSVIRRFRDVSGGGIATSASGLEVWLFFILSVLHLEHFARPRYQALQVPVTYGVLEVVSDRFLNAAHRMGVRVDAWTVNEPKEMDRLSEKGVDVVMTNRPGVLHRVLERRRGA